MTKTGRAAVYDAQNQPFVIREYPVCDVKPDERYRKYKHPIFTIPPSKERDLRRRPTIEHSKSDWFPPIHPILPLSPQDIPVEFQPPDMPITCRFFRRLNGWSLCAL